MPHAVAIPLFLAAALSARADAISDTEALTIVQKHCVICHAAKPAHESFQEAPKDVTLETVAEIKKHATAVYTQTVQPKAMPLGDQTAMTDDERAALGRLLKGLP